MDPEIQQILQALTIAARAGNAPGISAFLTTGAYSALNPNEKALVDRVLGRTRFAGKPGDFYLTWRAQSQSQGQDNQQQGQNGPSPSTAPATGYGTMGYRGAIAGPSAMGATLPSVYDNNQPGGAPGAGPVNNGPPTVNAQQQAPAPTGDFGSETTPQSIGLKPTAPSMATDNPTPTAPPAAGGGGNPGGFAAGFGDFLSGNDNGLIRFAMQAAGFNPDIVTPASKIAAQKLAALVKSRRAAYGAGNPDQNVGGLPQDIASFAKEYTTPGTDFYGNARKYAQGVLGGGMNDLLNGVSDQAGRFGQYQALIPMLYGGSNPLVQQAVSDQLGNIYDKWNLDSAMDPTNAGKADILQYIRNMPNLSPVLRSIFGPQR